MASVELRKVSKVFGQGGNDPVCAVDDLSLFVEQGEFVTVLGPSGSGKTTTLRLIAGLDAPAAGDILFDGQPVTQAKPHERDVAMVFQRDALLPHLSVFDNIALGLRLRRIPAAEAQHRITGALEMTGLKRLAARFPRELSGGERQRAALARAMVRQPKVFLFDEPLASLDATTRSQLRLELTRIHRQLGATILYVTHDQGEALALGNRVAVLKAGSLQQFCDPATLTSAPATSFVAGFVGAPPMNVLRGHVSRVEDRFVFSEHNVSGAAAGRRLSILVDPVRGERVSTFAGGNVILAVGADAVTLSDAEPVKAQIELVEPRGADTLVHLTTGAHRLIARTGAGFAGSVGQSIGLRVDATSALFFNPASDRPILTGAPA